MNEIKTTAIAIDETKQKIAQICNESKLPVCILELIIKDIYNEVSLLTMKQLQEEKEYIKKTSQEQGDPKIECSV